MPLEPIVERLYLAGIAEVDPALVVGVEEEAHVFDALLDERVGPSGEF